MTDRQYGLDQVEASWTVNPASGFQPLDLKDGCTDGTPFTQARNSPSFSMRSDGMGGVMYSWNPDHSGRWTLAVTQESKLYQDLLKRWIADQVTRNVVGNILIVDLSSGEELRLINARIIQKPDFVRGVEGLATSWVFGYARDIPTAASGDLNVL